jgi:hypothetical protein
MALYKDTKLTFNLELMGNYFSTEKINAFLRILKI